MKDLLKAAGIGTLVAFVVLLLFTNLDEALSVKVTERDVTFIVLSSNDANKRVSIQYVNGLSTDHVLGATETVQVKDNWYLGNWRSEDRYLALEASAGTNQVWKGKVGGLRIGLFSWFPHITRAELTGHVLTGGN